jgi:sec-independent protein translocase protein TatA
MNTNELTMVAWSLGWMEITLIMLAILVLFGGKKLPELAKGLAKGIKGFKAEMRDVTDAIETDEDTDAHASADEKTPSGDDEPKA